MIHPNEKYTKKFNIIVGLLGFLGLVMSLEPALFLFGQILYGFALFWLVIIPYFKKNRKNEKGK